MKRLIIIGGTMGVGKTAVSQELKKLLPHAVFLDGDWCWDADPFLVTDETKAMVQDNISYLLNGFLHCSAYENVIFCWVLHQQEILDGMLERLDLSACSVHEFSLLCSPQNLRKRIQGDIEAGRRTPDVLERAVSRLPLYDVLRTVKVCTDEMSAQEAAKAIAAYIGRHENRI